MLTRTKDADLVNDIFRDAFGDAGIDVSENLQQGAYALVDADGNGSVLILPRRKHPGVFSLTFGVRADAQSKGLGKRMADEALAWLFSETDATLAKVAIDPRAEAARSIADKLKETERPIKSGQRLEITCTREHFAKVRGGDV